MAVSKNELYMIEGVSKVFGGRYIFNNINFSIKEGEIFGIIGGSGSGKTTLLNLLIGFLKPERGDIKFREINLLGQNPLESFRSVYKYQQHIKKMYGFATQSTSFYPNLKVIENLRYFGSLYDLPKESIEINVESLLNLVDLAPFKYILSNKLSGGMQRRLDIACSLIHNPKILFLDEPTADLDPILSNKIWNMLRVINQRGTTVIIASHELSELEHLCDRIAIIKDGEIAAIGKPSELKTSKSSQQLLLISVPGNYKEIVNLLRNADKNIAKVIQDYDTQKRTLKIHTNNPAIVMPYLLKILEQKGEKLINIDLIKPSIGNVFENITREPYQTKKKTKSRARKK